MVDSVLLEVSDTFEYLFNDKFREEKKATITSS